MAQVQACQVVPERHVPFPLSPLPSTVSMQMKFPQEFQGTILSEYEKYDIVKLQLIFTSKIVKILACESVQDVLKTSSYLYIKKWKNSIKTSMFLITYELVFDAKVMKLFSGP